MTRPVAAAAAIALLLTPACERTPERAPAVNVEAAGAASPTARVKSPRIAFPPARDACELIPSDEISAVLGEPIQARREVVERPDESVCAYGPAGGWSVLYVTAYWRGGKQEWESRLPARGSGRALTGIGDAAHYGGILPSLVLRGDVLLEFAMPLLPDEERNFPILARTAVSRL